MLSLKYMGILCILCTLLNISVTNPLHVTKKEAEKKGAVSFVNPSSVEDSADEDDDIAERMKRDNNKRKYIVAHDNKKEGALLARKGEIEVYEDEEGDDNSKGVDSIKKNDTSSSPKTRRAEEVMYKDEKIDKRMKRDDGTHKEKHDDDIDGKDNTSGVKKNSTSSSSKTRRSADIQNDDDKINERTKRDDAKHDEGKEADKKNSGGITKREGEVPIYDDDDDDDDSTSNSSKKTRRATEIENHDDKIDDKDKPGSTKKNSTSSSSKETRRAAEIEYIDDMTTSGPPKTRKSAETDDGINERIKHGDAKHHTNKKNSGAIKRRGGEIPVHVYDDADSDEKSKNAPSGGKTGKSNPPKTREAGEYEDGQVEERVNDDANDGDDDAGDENVDTRKKNRDTDEDDNSKSNDDDDYDKASDENSSESNYDEKKPDHTTVHSRHSKSKSGKKMTSHGKRKHDSAVEDEEDDSSPIDGRRNADNEDDVNMSSDLIWSRLGKGGFSTVRILESI